MTTTPDEHARTMDAASYWIQFPVTWDPTDVGEYVVGVIEHLGEAKLREQWVPRVQIRQDGGELVNVFPTQKRLLGKLVQLKPKVGDRIKITYLGEDSHAAPGMSPTQRWEVRVRSGVTDKPPSA